MNRKNFYKYLAVNKEDERVGLYVTGAGCAEIPKASQYPPVNHPMHHYFHWSKGRRLPNYQILYLTKGEGFFESETSETQRIKAGDVFVLFPNVWHRYSPDKKTGWNECWVEFNGKLMEYFRNELFLDPAHPVFLVGVDNTLLDQFQQIIDLTDKEPITVQHTASGTIFQIIQRLLAQRKYGASLRTPHEDQMAQAKLLFRNKMSTNIKPETIAKELGMSYSLFRQTFKKTTGFSPLQYLATLRINKAKELLSATDLPIKEIALLAGLDSSNYLSRLFKLKTGVTPAEFRLLNRLPFTK